jgi:MoaA/NifB/PqqE/SkfB family radical SAM enzyme
MRKPVLLSIHPTMQCDYHCHNCYLKAGEESKEEKAPEFFLSLIDAAKKLGMTDVAIPLNYVNKTEDFRTADKNFKYYELIKDRTLANGLDLTVTCNYDFIENYKTETSFDGISLLTISINDFVTPTDEDKNKAIATMREMKSVVKSINCNILMSPNMIKLLNNGLAEKILEVADTIYLLSSQPLFVPVKNIYELIGKLDPRLIQMLDDRIFIDACIKREMGLTGGFCSKHDFIYVNPYGEVKLCSYDQRTLYKLENSDDFEYTYNTLYPQKELDTCDLVNGIYADEKKKLNKIRVASSL